MLNSKKSRESGARRITIAGLVLVVLGWAAGPVQAATVSPTSKDFGEKKIGTSTTQDLTITHNNADLTTSSISASVPANSGFDISANTCTGATLTILSPTCKITVRFTPNAINTYSSNVTITSTPATTPNPVPVTGASSAPTVTLNPTSLTFSAQDVSTSSASKTITLSSAGVNDLTSVAISASGDFSQTNTCGSTVTAGSSCTITVIFTPTATGARSGTLTVASNASGSPSTAALSGTGTAPAAPTPQLSPSSLSFADQTSGTVSSAKNLTLSNVGTAVLNITSIGLTGTNPDDFSQTNTCGSTLAGGANCSISVTFRPQDVRSSSATLSVVSNASGSPTNAGLSGNGVVGVPIASVSVPQLDFGVQKQTTTSAVKTVTLSNTGTVPMNISSISFTGTNSGDFAKAGSSTCLTTLAASTSCTVDVTFTPAGLDSRNATLVIATNASSSPPVNLVGTGVSDTKTVTVGTTTVALSTSRGTLTGPTTAATPGSGLPAGLTYPVGFFGFSVTGVTTGSKVKLTYTLSSTTSSINTYVKCKTSSSACAVLANAQGSPDLKSVSFEITDGSSDDDDGLANGTIVDPGAPAFNPTVVTASSTFASDSSSGAMEWMTLLLLGVPALLRRRRLH